ncbi:MAG TPA: alpha/beta hydrolase [Gaiellaceae bacterium]|nr:alpha/beta hydrolase [Gaiellaceae bacterium]
MAPASTAPASTGWNDERGVPCIRGENTSVRPSARGYFVTLETRMETQPRLLFVHGSVVNAELTWSAQKPLADRYDIVAPNRRGFPPGPDVESVDFEDEAVWLEPFLEPGAHLVGHSYGGLIALLAATRRPELVRSLTVIEPPAFGIARGRPGVDEFIEAIERHWREGRSDPGEFLRGFLALMGTSSPPGQFSPDFLQGSRTLRVERPPMEATFAFDELARAPFPKLVVSGAHSAAYDAVCDVLEERLDAERAVLPGAGHSVQRLGEPFNELLTDFVDRAEAQLAGKSDATPSA